MVSSKKPCKTPYSPVKSGCSADERRIGQNERSHMQSATFHHYGVPTGVKGKDEVFIEGAKVHVTSPEAHPFRIEFLRFEPDSPMPATLKTNCHAAFMVDDLEAALDGQNVIIPPFDATDTLRVAFIMDGPAVIELMQIK
jgi:hypothetical protein